MNLRSAKLTTLIVLEYLKRKRKVFIGGAVLVILLAVIQFKLNFFHSPNIIRVGLIGTYQEHDLPEELTRLVSAGLVEASEGGRIKPKLITGWEVNNDATQFKFKLKDNLRWSDNTALKAQDLALSIPNTNISFPDDRTVQFSLQEAYSPLPSLLIKPVFKKGNLLGIGPYRITKVEKSRIFITKIILESNE